MTDKTYKIRNKKLQYIFDVHPTGDMTSEIGRVFENINEAYSFLYNRQSSFFASGLYLDLTQYEVVEYVHYENSRTRLQNTVEYTIMNVEPSPHNMLKVKAIANQIVFYGFSCCTPPFLNFLLTSDKYYPILLEIVPPHMLNSPEDFMSVGILECDLDVLGSISLTATNYQLTKHGIVDLLNRRS